jgi:hypothetical protein
MHRWLALGTLWALVSGCGGSPDTIIKDPGVPSTCSGITDIIGCDQGAISYACTAGRPDQGGSDGSDAADLACSGGLGIGSNVTQYCCVSLASSLASCTALVIPGCEFSSIALACTGGTSPGSDVATLACSAPMAGSDGTDLYCCTTGIVPSACTLDASLACSGFGIGYECSGSATPADDNAGVTCTAGNGSASNGDTEFCCAPT